MSKPEQVRADLSKRVVVDTEALDWESSPSPGVMRRKLDRHGSEVGRVTSIVQYAAESSFPEHTHDGGEEIYVLEGVFSDATGDYPEGTYLRNPIGSSHAPSSKEGCTIFVKLHQFEARDTEDLAIATPACEFLPGQVDGLTVLPLHSFKGESTALVRWAPQTHFLAHSHFGGEEILVLEGVFSDEHGDYPRGTWIRSPHLSRHKPFSESGCLIYVKTGHLAPAG
jgi:anti-sigma factor ChrR (cupin superfamily)